MFIVHYLRNIFLPGYHIKTPPSHNNELFPSLIVHTTPRTSGEKNQPLSKSLRREVWNKYCGKENVGWCYTCGKKITFKKWHCSHVISRARGGMDNVENLRPCCPHCNLSMQTHNLYSYIDHKKLQGPGSKNAKKYLLEHPDQRDYQKVAWNEYPLNRKGGAHDKIPDRKNKSQTEGYGRLSSSPGDREEREENTSSIRTAPCFSKRSPKCKPSPPDKKYFSDWVILHI